jgi:hypothetical protein
MLAGAAWTEHGFSIPKAFETGSGLDELKKPINEAALKRIDLKEIISADEKTLQRDEQRLKRAGWFIVRLFTRWTITKLEEKSTAAQRSLATS